MTSLHYIIQRSLLNLVILSLGMFVVGCNSSSNETKKIPVVEDSGSKKGQNASFIALKGASVVTLFQGDSYNELGASAKNAKVTTSGGVDTETLGTYLITYTANDNDNNKNYKTRTVIVQHRTTIDSTVPTVMLKGKATVVLIKGEHYNELGATAVDGKEGELAVKAVGNVNTSKVGIYTLVYTATDSDNNSRAKTRTVIVVLTSNTPPPAIELNGETPMTHAQNNVYEELGVLVKNNNNVIITTTGEVNPDKPGGYLITYTATDRVNKSSTITRTVNVVDKTPPVIILSSAATLTLAQGGRYTPPKATATDNNDGAVIVTVEGAVDTNKVGRYELIYSAKDTAGNSSEIRRTVTVVDKTAPVITLIGKAEITHPQGSNYKDLGAKATDNNDAVIKVVTTGRVDINTIGAYELIYSVNDSTGNSSEIRRTVTVVDQTAPVIELIGKVTITHPQGNSYQDLGVKATDNNDAVVNVVTKGHVDTSIIGTYEMIYSATDHAGNKAEIIRTITVVDQIPPVFRVLGHVEVEEHKLKAITLLATDRNTIHYSLSGADSADFHIDAVTGVVVFNVAPKHSIKNKYTFTAIASDGANQTTLKVVLSVLKETVAIDDQYTLTRDYVLLDVLANDSIGLSLHSIVTPASHGTARIENNHIRYHFERGYTGSDFFVYQVRDAQGVAITARVVINVVKVAVATDDQYTLTNRRALLNVLENDYNTLNLQLSIGEIVVAPQNGIATIENNHIRFIANTYSDNLYQLENDSFVYEINDSHGNRATATVQLTFPSIEVQKINDTGITLCANGDRNNLDCPVAGYPAQDAEQGNNTMNFTRLNGRCVQDNVTGLTWEVKQSTGLHNANDTYTWFQPDDSKNGGVEGNIGREDTCYGYEDTNPSSYCNTDAYIKRVNDEKWCGYFNWRLPTIEEAHSIVDYSRFNPSINTGYFRNMKNERYWGSSMPSVSPGNAWLTDFRDGSNYGYSKNNSSHVHLVRDRL